MAAKYYAVSNLTKNGVMNDNGENLGRIDEFVVDIETGRISHAILAFGGFPTRAKLFAVPWELLDYSTHDRKFILNIPRDTIAKGPGYDDQGKLIESSDTYWLGDKYEYYSHKPEWEKKREEDRQEEVKRAQARRSEARHKLSTPVSPQA